MTEDSSVAAPEEQPKRTGQPVFHLSIPADFYEMTQEQKRAYVRKALGLPPKVQDKPPGVTQSNGNDVAGTLYGL